MLGAIAGLLGLAALGAWAIAGTDEKLGPRAPAERPALALLTSLPLIFPESFGLEGGGSPVLARLEQRYKVLPIGVADAASLRGHRLLLMAHPRAQPAEILVELDAWVRGGGRVLLLADPDLQWDSDRPLGDSLRPPPAFADTGLLLHWGLAFAGPRPDGPTGAGDGEPTILALAPGKQGGAENCSIASEGFLARCAIGKGRATVIADADFLDGDRQGAGDGAASPDLDLLISELAKLDSR